MTGTFDLLDRLQMTARHLEGLTTPAAPAARRGRHPPSSSAVAAAGHYRLARCQLRRGRPARARRHLRRALRHRPGWARPHYLLARIMEQGGERDAARATAHYRRAVRLRPERADWLADFGLFLIARADLDEGLESLRRAAALAPGQAAVISKVAEGLDRAGCRAEALWLLWAARGNHPNDARLTELWDAFLQRQGADPPGRQSSFPPSSASDAPAFISRRAAG